MTLGRDLTAVALGLHDLERRTAREGDLLDQEGFISIYCGGLRVEPRTYAAWDEVRRDLADLADRAAGLDEGLRAVMLRGMIGSFVVAARFYAGERIRFAEMTTDLVGAAAGPIDADLVESLRDDLDARLRRRGVGGSDLLDRLRAWRAAGDVSHDRLETVFRSLMAEAKARTDRMIFDTGDYDMQLNWHPGLPFGARCDFANGKMDLNPDLRLNHAELKQLVCHEVYPGHSTHMLFTRAEVDAGRSEPDALLCAANALNGCVQEGIGEQGVRLVDWIADEDDAIAMASRRLRMAAKTNAAWSLMEEARPEAEVADDLARMAGMDEATIRTCFTLARHPFRGPFIASYWTGSEAVRTVLDRLDDEGVRRFVPVLYGQLQSPASVALFH